MEASYAGLPHRKTRVHHAAHGLCQKNETFTGQTHSRGAETDLRLPS